MKFPGTRTVVTYALVGASIYGAIAGIAPEQTRDIVGFTSLALGFFFGRATAQVGTSTGGDTGVETPR